jgi:hypothetical protein
MSAVAVLLVIAYGAYPVREVPSEFFAADFACSEWQAGLLEYICYDLR